MVAINENLLPECTGDTRPNVVYEIRGPDGEVYKWGASGTPPNSGYCQMLWMKAIRRPIF